MKENQSKEDLPKPNYKRDTHIASDKPYSFGGIPFRLNKHLTKHHGCDVYEAPTKISLDDICTEENPLELEVIVVEDDSREYMIMCRFNSLRLGINHADSFFVKKQNGETHETRVVTHYGMTWQGVGISSGLADLLEVKEGDMVLMYSNENKLDEIYIK